MTTFPPSIEDNARAIAAARGYELREEPDGGIAAIDPTTGTRYAAAVSWGEMLSWLLAAPRLGDGAK